MERAAVVFRLSETRHEAPGMVLWTTKGLTQAG